MNRGFKVGDKVKYKIVQEGKTEPVLNYGSIADITSYTEMFNEYPYKIRSTDGRNVYMQEGDFEHAEWIEEFECKFQDTMSNASLSTTGSIYKDCIGISIKNSINANEKSLVVDLDKENALKLANLIVKFFED